MVIREGAGSLLRDLDVAAAALEDAAPPLEDAAPPLGGTYGTIALEGILGSADFDLEDALFGVSLTSSLVVFFTGLGTSTEAARF